MASFQRHELEKLNDGSYNVKLFLDPQLTEFADEFQSGRSQDKEALERSVKKYVKEKFPSLKVNAVKVMAGTMLVSTIAFAGGIGGSALAAENDGTTQVEVDQQTDQGLKDIAEGSYYEEAALALHGADIIKGFNDNTFRAGENISRGEAATILARSLGLEDTDAPDPGFADVKVDKFYYKSVAALKEAGIITGFDETTFGPDRTITRGELAKMIVLAYDDIDEADGDSTFTDVRTDKWYAKYANALKKFGITTGTSATTFSPEAPAKRGEVATFVYRSITPEKRVQVEADTTPSAETSDIELAANATNAIIIKMVVKNAAGDGITDLTADDFTIKVGDASYVVGQTATFSNFIEIGDGEYAVTFNPGFPINESVDVIADGVTIESGVAVNTAELITTPTADTSDVTVAATADNAVHITMNVKNANNDGITGLTADDFTVKIGDQSYVVGQTATFTGFTDRGNGEYAVTFNPGFPINETVDVIADDVTIESGVAVNTAELISTPTDDNSDVTVASATGNALLITMAVKNAANEGINGLTADDFTVKLGDQSYVVGQTPTFTGFTDQGDGVYAVTFDPGFPINETVDVLANGATIESGLAVNTTDIIASPVLESVTPASGEAVTLAADETFKLEVDAADEGLYELEVDHNFADLPEFSVYASEENPYGTDEDRAEFEALGVDVTYDAIEQKWVIDFGDAVTDKIVEQGDATFYLVLRDNAGNELGTMYGTTPENTFTYTVTQTAADTGETGV